jgi:hypothetical protein
MAQHKHATTTKPLEERSILPAHGDAIRIVPLNLPAEMFGQKTAPAAAPQLTYRNGPLIESVQVFTIFWGKGWKSGTPKTLVPKINKFFGDVLKSPLIDQLSEYNVAGQKIGRGSFTGSISITTPALKKSVTDTAIQHMLQNEIATNKALPQPGPNVLYFVYVQSGTKVVQGGGSSCQVFCGYHNDISGQIFYAVMPYPSCSGCTGNLDAFSALTSTSSHELCEAITDPIPGQGWYDDTNGEIGDICAWTTKTVDGYTVQLEWSNKQNKCM